MRKGIYNKITGRCGEDFAEKFLVKNKYKVIERNHRNKMGEIDIIARKGEDLVFVEVKTRSTSDFGTPAEAVTYYKKRSFVNAAKWYLMQNPCDMNIRFDIIEVVGKFTGDSFDFESINHIEQAFTEV